MALSDIDLSKVTYFNLNNQVNIPKNGRIQLEKDKEALEAFLKENVEPNLKKWPNKVKRMHDMVNEGYYEESIIDNYSDEFIDKLYKFLDSQNFKFGSFMAAYKFYAMYALKTNDQEYYLEDYVDKAAINALYMAGGDEKLAMDLADELINQRYQPATPTYMNVGRKRRGEFVSCFLLQPTDDMDSIGRCINSALQLSKIGGGVGITLNNLRAAGAPIKGIENAASGVVPVMKLLEDTFSYSNQLGQRQGAGVVYLSVFHPDIIDFLSTKKENADEKVRIKTLSLGVIVPDKFYELCKNNEDMYLFEPYDVEKEYGVPFSYVDITKEYDNLVANKNIHKKKIKARELEEEIGKLQQESGYPYVVNIDTMNKTNPVNGKIIMSNLCSEIAQVQTPSKINDLQEYEVLGTDISCNLGSTNIINLMKSPNFGKSVETMTRALTFVSDQGNAKVVPSIYEGNRLSHAIGLGAMNLHGYLAQNQIEYGSPESIEFTGVYFMLLNYWTLVASNKIAKERNETFHDFDKSDYANGKYFDKYVSHYYGPKSEKVKKLFKGIFIPNEDDWKELRQKVMKYGLYNAYRMAVAPTGSVSYVGNATSSLQPIIQKVEERQEGKIGKIYYPAVGLSNETMRYYESAYNIDMRRMIDLYAAAQEHVDQSISMTLYMRSEIPDGMYPWKDGRTNKMTTRDLSILRNYAWHKGIKSIYYTRTYTDDGSEAFSVNECESCSI